jgi:hypothetical protein
MTDGRVGFWSGAMGRTATMIRLARLTVPYLSYAVLKRVVPTTILARRAWRARRPKMTRDLEREQRAIATVLRLRRLFGGDRGDCLEAGLLLYGELSRAGADPRLVIGFARDNARVIGHAWVEVDGRSVGETDPADRFVPAVRFGAFGRPETPGDRSGTPRAQSGGNAMSRDR